MQACLQAILVIAFSLPFFQTVSGQIPSFDNGQPKLSYEVKGYATALVVSHRNAFGEVTVIDSLHFGRLKSRKFTPPPGLLYDAAGRLTDVRRYDHYGYLLSDEQVAAKKNMYDEEGRLIEQQLFGSNGKLVVSNSRESIITYEYNAGGQLQRENFLNHKRKMFEDAFGKSYITYDYDAKGRQTGFQYRDRTGELANAYFGMAAIVHTYDKDGNRVRTENRDAGGLLAPNDMAGAPLSTMKYDKKGNVTEFRMFYDQEKVMATLRYRYNKVGQLIEERWYAGKSPEQLTDLITLTYDEKGNIKTRERKDAEGKVEDKLVAGVRLKIKGWDWKEIPVIPDSDAYYGTITVKFKLREDGSIRSYNMHEKGASELMADHFRDVVNHLVLQPIGENRAKTGKLQFCRIAAHK